MVWLSQHMNFKGTNNNNIEDKDENIEWNWIWA